MPYLIRFIHEQQVNIFEFKGNILFAVDTVKTFVGRTWNYVYRLVEQGIKLNALLHSAKAEVFICNTSESVISKNSTSAECNL